MRGRTGLSKRESYPPQQQQEHRSSPINSLSDLITAANQNLKPELSDSQEIKWQKPHF